MKTITLNLMQTALTLALLEERRSAILNVQYSAHKLMVPFSKHFLNNMNAELFALEAVIDQLKNPEQ